MIRAPRSRTHDPDGHALATLGMVALVVMLLVQRILPRCTGEVAMAPLVLRLQRAMTVLAILAWREVEAPRRGTVALDEMEPAAREMLAALRDLLSLIARQRRGGGRPFARRPAPGEGHAPFLREPVPFDDPAPSVRARDGPPQA